MLMRRLLCVLALIAVAAVRTDAQPRYLADELAPVESYMYRSYRHSGGRQPMNLTGGLDWYGGFTIGASQGPYKPGFAKFRLDGEYESLMFVLGIWALNIYSSSGHMAGNGYGEYLLASYHGANTAGGMLYGIISYPLMRVITTVGALVVVCAAFFVMAFIALMPTIKKDVTYVAVDPSVREKPRKGSRIDRQRAPAITDLSSAGGGNSLYVVDVEGDPLSRSRRKNKGAEGYDPLYPNAGARYEDELRSEDVAVKPDRFSSRSLAKDILLSRDPAEDSLANYKTITNPEEALSNPSAPYSAVRRNELRRRLGVDDTDAMARDIVRERDFGEEKKEESAPARSVDPNARGASALGYSSFDALKADRTKQFGEMFGTAPARDAAQSPSSVSSSRGTDTVRREVPKPSRQIQRPAAQTPVPPRREQSAANMAGLHGSVSRAITGEEKAAPPAARSIPDAPAYEKPEAAEKSPTVRAAEERFLNGSVVAHPPRAVAALFKRQTLASSLSAVFDDAIIPRMGRTLPGKLTALHSIRKEADSSIAFIRLSGIIVSAARWPCKATRCLRLARSSTRRQAKCSACSATRAWVLRLSGQCSAGSDNPE